MLRSIRCVPTAFTAFARTAVTRVTSDSQCNSLLRDPRPTVLHFRKSDCASCDTLHPKLEALADQHKNIQFASVDIDDCKEVARRFNIKGTPSIAAFKNGEHLDTMAEVNDNSLHDFITELHGQLQNEQITVKKTVTRTHTFPETSDSDEVIIETEEIIITGDNAKLPERGLANQPAQDLMDHEMAHHNKQAFEKRTGQTGQKRSTFPQRKKQETYQQTI